MSEDLIAELRARKRDNPRALEFGQPTHIPDAECVEAADHIQALQEQVRVLREALEEAGGVLAWINAQAENAMVTTASSATASGDPDGGLEAANRYASDIAINCQMMLPKIAALSTYEATKITSRYGNA